MKLNRIFGTGLVAFFGCVVLPSLVAAGEVKTPTQAYLDYHATILKATTLDEVLPRLSDAYRGMLESRPKKDRPLWLGRLKEAADIKNLQITKETVEGDKCTLEATGTSARGNAIHGKVHLVKEGGAWKLDEEFWAT